MLHFFRMKILFPLLFLLFVRCATSGQNEEPSSNQYLTVLGIARYAGYEKANCRLYWDGTEEQRYATDLGLVDPETNQTWLFETTPDFKYQLHQLQKDSGVDELSGIFLTHAHNLVIIPD